MLNIYTDMDWVMWNDRMPHHLMEMKMMNLLYRRLNSYIPKIKVEK